MYVLLNELKKYEPTNQDLSLELRMTELDLSLTPGLLTAISVRTCVFFILLQWQKFTAMDLSLLFMYRFLQLNLI